MSANGLKGRLPADASDTSGGGGPDQQIDDLDATSPWSRHARLWDHVTSPLRPHPQDISSAQSTLDAIATRTSELRALLLGVTPELVQLRWPAHATLLAIDASRAMILRHWSPPSSIKANVAQGRWESLAEPESKFQLVLADGSLNILSEYSLIRQVMTRISLAIDPEGCFLVRLFTRPEITEPLSRVVNDMLNGRIGNVHVAKWRIAMALHGSLQEGVNLHSIWETFKAAAPNARLLSKATGWSIESIETVDNYCNLNARYFFPTMSEFSAMTAGLFMERGRFVPSYELGERCPTIELQLRSTSKAF